MLKAAGSGDQETGSKVSKLGRGDVRAIKGGTAKPAYIQTCNWQQQITTASHQSYGTSDNDCKQLAVETGSKKKKKKR